jgi:hypothetical protein
MRASARIVSASSSTAHLSFRLREEDCRSATGLVASCLPTRATKRVAGGIPIRSPAARRCADRAQPPVLRAKGKARGVPTFGPTSAGFVRARALRAVQPPPAPSPHRACNSPRVRMNSITRSTPAPVFRLVIT